MLVLDDAVYKEPFHSVVCSSGGEEGKALPSGGSSWIVGLEAECSGNKVANDTLLSMLLAPASWL